MATKTGFPFPNIGKDNQEVKKKGVLVGSPRSVGGNLYVDVRTVTSNGQNVIIRSVRLQDNSQSMIAPLRAGDRVTMTFDSPDSFANRDSTRALASRATADSPNENQAIPASLISKIDQNALLRGNNNVCLGMKKAMNDLNKMRQNLAQKDSLVMIQHPRGGKSSSGLALSQDGELVIYDGSGKNKTEMKKDGMTFKGKEFDTTDSSRARSFSMYGGLPGQASTLTDYIPKGNVFTPHVTHIPHVTKIVLMIGLARAMIAVGKIAKEGLQEMRQLRNTLKQAEEAEKAQRLLSLQQVLDQSLSPGERAAALSSVLGEKTFKNDKERLAALKNIERMKALIPVIAGDGQISPQDEELLKAMISHEQKELKKAGSTKSARSKAFDQIAGQAGERAKGIVQKHVEQGAFDPFSREKKTTLSTSELLDKAKGRLS